MSRRTRAFATLVAVGLLALTAALLAGAVMASRQLLVEEGRAERLTGARAEAWKLAQALLTELQGSWNADAQSLDAWWAGKAGAFPEGSELASLSARVNLNSISPFY